MCSNPDGRGSTPSGGSGWFVRWATKNTLSRVTVALSISGRTRAMLNPAFDSSRVSSWNRPSLSPSMSPYALATRKLSPSFSTWVVNDAAVAAGCTSAVRGTAAACGPGAGPGGIASGETADAVACDGEVLAIEFLVAARHRGRGEAAFEGGADARAVVADDFADRGGRGLQAVDDAAGDAILQHLRDRAAVPGDDRGSAGHRLDHHQAERLRPVDREQQRRGIAEEARLARIADL